MAADNIFDLGSPARRAEPRAFAQPLSPARSSGWTAPKVALAFGGAVGLLTVVSRWFDARRREAELQAEVAEILAEVRRRA